MAIRDMETFARLTAASLPDADRYWYPMTDAMKEFGIETKEQECSFLAQISVESQGLSTFEEGLYYRDAARLARIFPRSFTTARSAEPYVKNPKALAKLLYNGYYGRGPIQLTWERNYAKYGDLLGVDLVGDPDLLLDPVVGSRAAACYWDQNGCNDVADDVKEVTKRINGPALMHLDRREDQYIRNLQNW